MKRPFKIPQFASITSGTLSGLILSVIFAVVSNIEFIVPHLQVKKGVSSKITIRIPSSVYLRSNLVKHSYTERWYLTRIGEKITDGNGDRIKFINSYLKLKRSAIIPRLITFFIAILLLTIILSHILRNAYPGKRRYLRTELTCYLMLFLTALGVKGFTLMTNLPYTILPLAAVSVVCAFFLGRQIATIISITVAFMACLLLDVDIIALAFFLLQGLGGALAVTNGKKKNRFLLSTVTGTVAGVAIITAITLIISSKTDDKTIQHYKYALIFSSIGSGVLIYPLAWILYAIERPMLGIVSQSKLNELQELSHPLLKKFRQQAPATWEHCKAIANLAEEAASLIGADALLVRVGAYFHDIGKAATPEYFVENYSLKYSLRNKGNEGPHENLPPERSAELIIDHVTEGVKILRSNSMPEAVIEFVYMHHGTEIVEYFWRKYQKEAKEKHKTEEEVKKTVSYFTYPGIKPQSPETAILMLADTVEAVSRTLSEYTKDEIQKVVSYVVIKKLMSGQLDDSGLKASDLKVIVRSFVDTILFSHHSRIKYQWQEEKKSEKQPPQKPESPEPSQKTPAPLEAKSLQPSAKASEHSTLPPRNQHLNMQKAGFSSPREATSMTTQPHEEKKPQITKSKHPTPIAIPIPEADRKKKEN